MKKLLLTFLIAGLMLCGCSNAEENQEPTETAETQTEEVQNAITVQPLPETTMDDLTNAILSVSLEEGDAYVDDSGKMQMDLTIYSYDKYDMVDIAAMKVGDTIVTHEGSVEITSLDQTEGGLILINGGIEQGGFDLFTNDDGIYYQSGFDDVKSWYEVGTATIPVSVDFKGIDSSDLDKGEIVIYPGDFLTEGVVDYYFIPQNTTVRVENGEIVSLERIYTP